jgi:hypothetical protein
LLAFALAFGTRVTYILATKSYTVVVFPGEMERVARNLAEHGELANAYGPHSGPSSHVAPLYPALLSLIYRAFGTDSTGRLVQELCATAVSSLAIALLALVPTRGLHKNAGLTAALVSAILPVNLWVETSGSWEQPYSAFVLMLTCISLISLHENRWSAISQCVSLGLLLGLGALISPVIVPAGGLMFLAELVSHREARARVIRGGLIIGLLSMLIVAPWTYRNYKVFGAFVPIRSSFGLAFWLGNNPKSDGTPWGAEMEHPMYNAQELQLVTGIGEVKYGRRKLQDALKWIHDNPGNFTQLTLWRVRMFWFPSAEMWPRKATAVRFKFLLVNLFAVGGLAGLLSLWLRCNPLRFLLTAALFGASATYAISFVDLRYRYPIYGLLLLLSSEFFWHTLDRSRLLCQKLDNARKEATRSH